MFFPILAFYLKGAKSKFFAPSFVILKMLFTDIFSDLSKTILFVYNYLLFKGLLRINLIIHYEEVAVEDDEGRYSCYVHLNRSDVGGRIAVILA